MSSDEPFPLAAVPLRGRHAILDAFQGRCPSIREVGEISDRTWLTLPGVGPVVLEAIRRVTDEQQVARLSDAELLERLEWLQKELRWLEGQLKPRRVRHGAGTAPSVLRDSAATPQ